MSVEDLKKFGKLCSEDEAVRKRAKEIGLTDVDALIAYGKELGLEFDQNDMLEAARESGFNKDELTEEDLEKIAGGAATLTMMALVGGGVLLIGGIAATAAVVFLGSAALTSALTNKKW